MTHHCKDRAIDGEYCPYPENLNYPLDKIFGSIPAGSSGFTSTWFTPAVGWCVRLLPPMKGIRK
jgi:hypothetical protein